MPFYSCCCSELEQIESDLTCRDCGKNIAKLVDGIIVFNDAIDKFNFFEKIVVEKLNKKYSDYNREHFLRDLNIKNLWEMDDQSKCVGITRKFWWEDHIEKIENKRILEVGCGVTYLSPMWLETQNELTAFDACIESVTQVRDNCEKFGVPINKGTFICADAATIQFSGKFDIISINNALHHIEDRVTVIKELNKCLNSEGKLLLVEPNYYYPPRWFMETDFFDPFNPFKNYALKNHLMEKNEKGITFPDFKRELAEAGFRIIANEKDPNYAGYFLLYWMTRCSALSHAIHFLDRWILQWILPRIFTPFEYIIAEKI